MSEPGPAFDQSSDRLSGGTPADSRVDSTLTAIGVLADHWGLVLATAWSRS